MKKELRGLVAVNTHIKAYWQRIHGVARAINNSPQNLFIEALNDEIANLIRETDEVLGSAKEPHDLAEVYTNLLQAIEKFTGQLEEAKAKYPDPNFQALIVVLKEDMDGAKNQINAIEINPTAAQDDIIAYAKSLGGVVVNNIPQDFHPLFGSEVNAENKEKMEINTGSCAGLVDDWGNKRVINTAKVFKTHEKKSAFEVPEKGSPYKVKEALMQHKDFRIHFYYNAIVFFPEEGSGHIIGIKQCNGIDEFEVFDPNFGTFRFPNKDAATSFVEYLMSYYFLDMNIKTVDLVRMPVDNPRMFVKPDEPRCGATQERDEKIDVENPFRVIISIIKQRYQEFLKTKENETLTALSPLLNDTLLNRNFIKTLSAGQSIELFKFLVTPRENGHSYGECFQYNQRASWLERHSHKKIQQAVGRVSPPKTRWKQIVLDLRKCCLINGFDDNAGRARLQRHEFNKDDKNSLFNDKFLNESVLKEPSKSSSKTVHKNES